MNDTTTRIIKTLNAQNARELAELCERIFCSFRAIKQRAINFAKQSDRDATFFLTILLIIIFNVKIKRL